LEYDALPEWSELSIRVDAGDELDPVEQFIYDNEPCVYDEAEVFRKSFQEALYFFGGAPLNNSEEKQNDQPTKQGRLEDSAQICHTCHGDGIARDGGYPCNGKCGRCGGSGKLLPC
jgi:hypothetical protein